MLKLCFVFLAAVITTCCSKSTSDVDSQGRLLPGSFEEDAFSHIRELVRIGPRPAASENEMEAAKYIEAQFSKLGLETAIEMFDYRSFEFASLNFTIGQIHIEPTGLGFTPYREVWEYSGSAILIDSNNSSSAPKPDSTAGKTIISNDFNRHFELLKYNPGLIIYVNPDDFNKLKASESRDFTLKISGDYKRLSSPIVIGTLGRSRKASKEIIVGAHLDSYRNSPGANDNGSGVGVMIELASYLKSKSLPKDWTLKFIAFGAEEVGVLGSRRYVQSHLDSLERCKLYFNIDNVGGAGQGSIELLGGVRETPPHREDELSKMIAANPWEGVSSYWRGLPEPLIMEYLTVFNHPPWLVENIKTAIRESGYSIRHAENMGADQMSFAREGIVTTSIGISGDQTHTPNDGLDKVHKESLRKAGEITLRVILKTMGTEDDGDGRRWGRSGKVE